MAASPAMATLSSDQPGRRPRRNRGFAKSARKFVDRALTLPGFAMLMLGGGAAIVLTTIMGAFGTIEMPLAQRLGFWSVLIGWNIAKWLAWFAWTVRRPQDWRRASLIGAVVINLPLPLEIPAALWLFGIASEIDPARTWIEAAAISATLFAVLFFVRPSRAAPAALANEGILFRCGVRDLTDVQAVTAEDHYCRLHLRNGAKPLVLARFADTLAELSGIDGEQIHRGAWIAAASVDGATREGRAWRLVLADGTRLPVSASHVAAVRTRGWLRIKPKLGVA
jgi:hypothetical protein